MSEKSDKGVTSFLGSGFIKGLVVVANLIGIVIFSVLYFIGWFTTIEAASYNTTYAVWTFLPMMIPHIAVVIPGLFMIRPRAAGAFMGAVVVIMYLVAIVSDSFITVLYWILWWNCIVRKGHGSLTGVGLSICVDDEAMLTTIWVLVTVLAFTAVLGFIAHALFYYRTAMQSQWFKSKIDSLKSKGESRSKYETITPADPEIIDPSEAGARLRAKWGKSITGLNRLGNGMRHINTLL